MFHYEREPVSPLRRRYLGDLRLRNKWPCTIEAYVLSAVQFTRHCRRSPELVGPDELRTSSLTSSDGSDFPTGWPAANALKHAAIAIVSMYIQRTLL